MRRLTNELSVARGIYHSACKCRTEIRVRPGDRFPECPMCRSSVVWLFTRSAFDDVPPTAAPPEAHGPTA